MKTPLESLNAWLEHPVYDTGVILYEKLIGTGFLLGLLKTGEDAFNRQKLTQALDEKRQALQAEADARKASYPPSLVAQLERGGPLMDERTILKERMRNLYNSGVSQSEELKTMAFRILAIKTELDGIYGQRHFFEQNGILPHQASLDEAMDTPDQLLRRRNTLRTYVSKYKVLLTRHFDAPRQKKYKAKLEAFQQELYQIDAQLAILSPNTP